MSGKNETKVKSSSNRNFIAAVLIGIAAAVVASALVLGMSAFPQAANNSSLQTSTPIPTNGLPTATATPSATAKPTTATTDQPSPSLQITGLNLQINYAGSDQGYFGPVSQAIKLSNQANGYLTVQPGQQFFLYFTMNAPTTGTRSDSITQITVGTPGFTLESIQPQTPIAFSTGSSIQITVTLTAPQTTYNGPIQLVLTTLG